MIFKNNNITLCDIYSNSISLYGERVAFSVINGEKLTYNSFGERVERVIQIFNEAGLQKGDKIAILAGNNINWPVSYFAATTSGRVAVPILPDFTAFEIVNIIEHSECKALIVSSKLEYKIPEHLTEKLSLIIKMDNFEVTKKVVSADIFLRDEPNHEDVATIIYTSGTSGASKGVMLTHANLVAQTKMTTELFPILKEDIFLSILPLSHTYECSIGMLLPFTHGASVVYLDGAPTPSILMPALKEVKPTIMLSVPLIVEKIYKIKIRPIFTKNLILRVVYSIWIFRRLFHKAAGKKLLETFGGNLRFFGIGGSRLDGVVENFLADAGFPYAIGYGLTETSPLLAGVVPGKVKWQSTGPALNGVEIKIDNPNNKKIGEIVVKGPNVMKGYYKDPQSTMASFTEDGWFRTKDLGFMDREGYLYIKGRKDNMILSSSGENIYPEDIESIINEFDLVLESLVIERKGKLVAKVHFNYDEIKESEHILGEGSASVTDKVTRVKRELLLYVNDRVNKSSKLSEIVEQPVPFEKTATQKIKRYLYN
ncbi:MAG: acyl-CoA synthetase [Bacteroidetes bacterium GWF2_41_61]|nr:MAG: acyl-CoA synthetase [Bacteroidetes bacterium GWE2_40_15]OFY36766.1 MAG: acyl-CoA synthetase [Bacteroidetes bacterium GWF2_41_61]OFY91720.1 MAG: acyl-CoA synthetase [Bacteroidetes bacterium RIFOXYA12_FULL_40_10]HBZ25828.1 acyl-CoA synthetase [Rikenellaceae bacterium]